MDRFKDRVAAITGAASGIGLALAERAADEGMTVVMADVEATALERAAKSVRGRSANVVAQRLDVTDEDAVEAFASRVFSEFGAVHMLCNNAGVLNRERPAWEHSIADWRWVLNVNLRGVIHGVRAFVPRMLASGQEGHIVNTASMAGLITGGIGTAVYDASKHAVLSFTESLYRDLAISTSKVSASVLCPGVVTTNIFTAERNRPADLDPAEGAIPESRVTTAFPASSFDPSEVVTQVFDAVREKRFYILASQPVIFEWTKMGHDRMWEGKNPAVPRHLIAAREAAEAAQ
ncbi:MAG TPA: SDR family NAD(P)-dependent oxidoreductase [Tepidiformaceae bacterium]|nr:SDR family NAD(P)-dependent oxidoreductase [Tepidiformaceae bacterium]